jgi:hypothetical protein
LIPLLMRSPGEAFGRLAANPQWLGPAILCVLLLGASTWIALPPALEYQIEATRGTMEKFDLGAEATAEALAKIPDPRALTLGDYAENSLLSLATWLPVLAIGMFVFHLLAKAFGTTTRLRDTAALYFLAYVASAAGAVLKSALIRASGTIEVTLGPGILLPGLEYHSTGAILLDLFDVFSLVNLVLLVLGARMVYRATRGMAWTVGGAYWILKALFVFLARLGQAWSSGA